MKKLPFLVLLPLLAGCIVNRPLAHKITTTTTFVTNGVPVTVVTEDILTKSTTFAAGDAKQAVATLAAKSTKTTVHAGAEGINQEASTIGLQQMFDKLLNMAFQAGKASAGAPTP